MKSEKPKKDQNPSSSVTDEKSSTTSAPWPLDPALLTKDSASADTPKKKSKTSKEGGSTTSNHVLSAKKLSFLFLGASLREEQVSQLLAELQQLDQLALGLPRPLQAAVLQRLLRAALLLDRVQDLPLEQQVPLEVSQAFSEEVSAVYQLVQAFVGDQRLQLFSSNSENDSKKTTVNINEPELATLSD